jgi:nucleoporin POM152
VTDSNGCKRPLTTSRDLSVQVRRSKPSVRFNGINDKKELIIREGDEARLPIRLTGEGPWTIDYSTPTSASKINTFKAHQPNVDLLITSAVKGTYRLVSVRDKFCPGEVVDNANEWKVGILERPRVGFNEKTSRNKVKGGVIKRQGVCQNKVDQVELNFEGTSESR